MGRFDYFAIIAEMRTGSNFLEANLNSIKGISCQGEAFNHALVGYPGRTELLGVTQQDRDRDPALLINAIRSMQGVLGGFRYFSDHDPRVLDLILPDERCAKIILTRNPIESYVSRKIAMQTQQWKLTNPAKARRERITFDTAEFLSYLNRLTTFQLHLTHSLQTTGQTAFYLDYEDLRSLDVINGLARFLGVAERIEVLDLRLKKQNPEPIDDKVVNPDDLKRALSDIDWFNFSLPAVFEPRRGPAVQRWLAAARTPVLYIPLNAGPETVIIDWLTRLDDGVAPAGGFNLASLRDWKDSHPGHRSFAVLRHPLARAHAAFCDGLLDPARDNFQPLRHALAVRYGLVLPLTAPADDSQHKAAFRTFLVFLKSYVGGQTNFGVEPSLASQLAHLQGIAQLAPPDMILREDRLADDLTLLLWQAGREDAPELPAVTDPHAERLARIVDDDLQALARDAYHRDFSAFDFGPWTPHAT